MALNENISESSYSKFYYNYYLSEKCSRHTNKYECVKHTLYKFNIQFVNIYLFKLLDTINELLSTITYTLHIHIHIHKTYTQKRHSIINCYKNENNTKSNLNFIGNKIYMWHTHTLTDNWKIEYHRPLKAFWGNREEYKKI